MNKTANTWRLVPVAAAQHELAEIRAALGFLPQGYAAMAGLDRLADLLAASEPSTTLHAGNTKHDEPITVAVDHDPRGVGVGVWQGSHCIYSGAHPLPAAAGVSTVENKPAAYLTLDEDGSPCMLFFDVVEARAFCEIGEEPEALWRHPAPAAGDAQISAYALPDGTRVERAAQPDGAYLWAVRRNGDCLGRDRHWSYEPLPSSRSQEWLALHRFPTAQAAIDAAIAAQRKGDA
ncbi:hypothetical protein [Achromobacter xylosoxidans]|uniref:hypothetical protein n=1 Tax=Alcaligenes xylosoxydans xylosoxydans TaxID=85698 RepID=UPI001FF265CD|nr:hypothetical protein [Achromobacter xylosoxidans]